MGLALVSRNRKNLGTIKSLGPQDRGQAYDNYYNLKMNIKDICAQSHDWASFKCPNSIEKDIAKRD